MQGEAAGAAAEDAGGIRLPGPAGTFGHRHLHMAQVRLVPGCFGMLCQSHLCDEYAVFRTFRHQARGISKCRSSAQTR